MLLPVALALLQLSISSKPPSLVKPLNDEKAAASAPAPVEGADAAAAEPAGGAPADESKSAANVASGATSSGGSTSASASANSSAAAAEDTSAKEDAEVRSASPDLAANAAATVVEPTTAPDPAEPYSSSLALTTASPAAMISAAEKADEQRRWTERQKHIWLGLSIAQSSAAAFDAYSTRRVVGSGLGTEMNPLLRPFAGNASMYAAVQVGPVLIDYISRRMLMSHRSWMRRSWWVPQVAGTALSLISGARNMSIFGGQ